MKEFLNKWGGAIAFVIVVTLALVYIVSWYSHDVSGSGKLAVKWVEYTHSTNCDKDGKHCTTSTTEHYYVKFYDGKVFTLMWGWWQWAQLTEEHSYAYQAKGYWRDFFGQRWIVPTIFSFSELK